MYEIDDIIASAEEDSSGYPDGDGGDSSWFIEPGTAAVKKADRHVFLYRETLLSDAAAEYFSVAGLGQGQKQRIVLWYGTRRFDAFIERTVHDPPRTRMIWKADFAGLLREKFPQWHDFFKKNRAESMDTPSLQFTKRPEPGQYDVGLEGMPPQEPGGEAQVPFSPGDVIDNSTLASAFRCSRQGAIRRSFATKSLVLVSDHTTSAFEDKWTGKTFHFTGMGLGGESLALHQNKALAESRENGVNLYLFEVFKEGQYVYIGEAGLAENPYLSRQPDTGKNPRDVYIFPLQLRSHKPPPAPKKELLQTKEEITHWKIQKMPLDELEFQARYALKEGGKREVVSEVYERDQLVSEYAKRRANGTCQLCGQPAPFSDRYGDPFLEIHHIVPLPEGGPDTIENVVALCPNCHRKVHILQLPGDVARLRSIAGKRN